MTRLLALLTALLVLLALADSRIRQSRQEARQTAGTLRPLVSVPVEQVHQFEIAIGNRSWTYVRRGTVWRYPTYFDAFVQVQRVEQLLGSLLQSYATPVSAEPGDLSRLGLAPAQAMRVTLADGAGRTLAEIRVGRGIPSPHSGEAYAQPASQDTLFHLHANPRLALDDLARPMVDPLVLPRGLDRNPLAEIRFAASGDYPLERLHRVQTAPAAPQLPGLPPQGPAYEWIATISGQKRTCVTSSAAQYTGFLDRLRYAALHPPGAYASGTASRALYLKDDSGRTDTLEIGAPDAKGAPLLRLRTTGHVLSIAPEKAALLFPTIDALLDSLPHPSPYQHAEPFSPSPF